MKETPPPWVIPALRNSKFFNREGKPIDAESWWNLTANDSYAIVRQYDNGKVRLVLRWMGEVKNAANVWPSHRQLFKLSCHNYVGEKLVPDPGMNELTFATAANGIQKYEEFLIKWTACQRNDDGSMNEADNSLAPPPPPPPPPPPDIPKTSVDDGVGAW
jgi:hypothetical protein